jgi:hypothetical protein
MDDLLLATPTEQGETTTAQALSVSANMPYPQIDIFCKEIRLFELTSAPGSTDIQGRFHCVALSQKPIYAALSYTWSVSMISITKRFFFLQS